MSRRLRMNFQVMESENRVIKEIGEIPFDLSLLSKGISSFEAEDLVITFDSKDRPLKISEVGYDFYISPLRFA